MDGRKPLPSERLLAVKLGVNRSTITAAYAELAAEGLIEGHRGGGTTVINNTWTLLAATSPPDWNKYVNEGIHSPNLSVIQEINKAEFVPGIIRLGTGKLYWKLANVIGSRLLKMMRTASWGWTIHRRALKALDKSGSVLYTGTLSKTLSPGLRIGWIAGPERVINRLANIKQAASLKTRGCLNHYIY